MRHFLQSPAWKNFERALGKQVYTASGENFSYLALLETTKLGPYLYLPYGPTLSLSKKSSHSPESALTAALDSLKLLAEDTGAFFIRLEPTYPFPASYLTSLGLEKSTDINPADTWVLDLRPPRETILTNMSQGTRTRHNQFSKKGLSVSVSQNPEDIKYLIHLQHKLAEEKHLNTFSDAYLKTELAQPFASLYLVHYETKIISASLFFDDKKSKTRFYMQSATDSDYKKLPATVGLLSSAIFDAKAAGLEHFDFWGIAPDGADANHPWAGFTQFKKSFGGAPVHYSGTYDLPLNEKKYSLYTSLRSLNRKLRKLTA